MLYFLLSFLDFNILPTAYAQGSSDSGESSSESSSGGEESDMELLSRIAKESVDRVVSPEYNIRMLDSACTESAKINVVYASFFNSLMECKELDLDQRNEAMTMLKDTLVSQGFNQHLVNDLVPMNPLAAADVSSSSSDSDSEFESQKDTLNSNQSQQQSSDSGKINQQKTDIGEPSNKKRRID